MYRDRLSLIVIYGKHSQVRYSQLTYHTAHAQLFVTVLKGSSERKKYNNVLMNNSHFLLFSFASLCFVIPFLIYSLSVYVCVYDIPQETHTHLH